MNSKVRLIEFGVRILVHVSAEMSTRGGNEYMETPINNGAGLIEKRKGRTNHDVE
jgi:hypothetical protein